MRILVYSIFSPPEIIGIGKYNGDLIDWLSKKGYEIDLVTTFPFYPDWSVYKGYEGKIFSKESVGNGINFYRSWCYVPKKVTGKKRLLHEISFLISSTFNLIRLFTIKKYDKVLLIVPPFHLGFPIIVLKKFFHAKIIYHIQDLQVDAARELKMIPNIVIRLSEKIEKIILKKANLITTISKGMIKKIQDKSISKEKIYLFPNWTDTRNIKPIDNQKLWLHKHLGLEEEKKLVVYSGNIGEKQGLEILIPVCKYYENIDDVHFVILGNGSYKEELIRIFKDKYISNVTFGNLVAKTDLNKMLNSSFTQLVIQKSVAEDSFLPSKLTNILSAGVPSVVTANPNTSLYHILEENMCGIVVAPDSAQEIIKGIEGLLHDPVKRKKISKNSREYALKSLSKDIILTDFETNILKNK
ncbi:MAG: WcaI family glycosyltransferase [Balneolaceae bacterium]